MNRTHDYCLLLFIMLLIIHASEAFPASPDFSMNYSPGVTGLRGVVTDRQNGEPLPARLVLTDAHNSVIGSYYNRYPGFFTGEDGTFHFDLLSGEYTLEVFRGIDYVSQTHTITVRQDQVVNISIALQPWVALRKLGWVNGDGHAHLYTDIQHDEAMLSLVRRLCRAQGVDFLCTNQGWACYDDHDCRDRYARFSDDRFLLYYGAEMPKYRTGHTWWLGLESCRDYFAAAMDTSYENHYYQEETGTSWDFTSLPMPFIPDEELVSRFKRAEGALACIPHPTSWWWQKRGVIEKYTTNVCAYLSFGLLAGKLWDGLVVMGYDSDHYFYQNLWFHILNQGYRMTPLAELDGGYGPDNKFPYGTMRVYYQVGDTLSMDRLIQAVRQGRTFVTSGPLVFTDLDNKYRPGDELPANGAGHNLHIDAYASGDADDYLTWLVVFRNGQIHKLWDLRAEKPRHYVTELPVQESSHAWYVIKAYGRKSWELSENLDVMAVCRKIEQGVFNATDNNERDICLTSPYYFRPPGASEPAALESQVAITLLHPVTGQALPQGAIEVQLNGTVIGAHPLKNGKVSFSMPCNAILKISAPGLTPITRCLYLDYPPQQKLIETLANGSWLQQNNWQNTMHPGQVPWEAFHFDKTKEILTNVDWIIVMQPNERDALWKDFETLF